MATPVCLLFLFVYVLIHRPSMHPSNSPRVKRKRARPRREIKLPKNLIKRFQTSRMVFGYHAFDFYDGKMRSNVIERFHSLCSDLQSATVDLRIFYERCEINFFRHTKFCSQNSFHKTFVSKWRALIKLEFMLICSVKREKVLFYDCFYSPLVRF